MRLIYADKNQNPINMNRADMLQTAAGHVTKDRQADHGNPEDSFAAIARLWEADLGIKITSTDVCRLMILFKMARAKFNPGHDDNWIDAAGYSACASELSVPDAPMQGPQLTESDNTKGYRIVEYLDDSVTGPRVAFIKELASIHMVPWLPKGAEATQTSVLYKGKIVATVTKMRKAQ